MSPRKGRAAGIPLVQAAARARTTYLGMRDFVLRGAVRGWQDVATRKWFVDPVSLQSFIEARKRGREEVPHE